MKFKSPVYGRGSTFSTPLASVEFSHQILPSPLNAPKTLMMLLE